MFNDLLLIATCLGILTAVLYLRRFALGRAPKARKEGLAPPDFYKLCPPIPEGQRPTILWGSSTPLSEWSRDIITYMIDRLGWEVIVVAPTFPAPEPTLSQLHVQQRGAIQTVLRRTSILIGEGELCDIMMKTAEAARKPFVGIGQSKHVVVHLYPARCLVPPEPDYSLVVHQPFYAVRHATYTTRRYITMIGAGDLAYAIVRAMPDREFLLVAPRQAPPRGLKNATVWPRQEDRRNAWALTAVYLALDPETPWVLPLEAAASGIPTVASGEAIQVKEALGELSIAVDGGVAEWVQAIQGLRGPTYETLTRNLVAHAARYDPSQELARMAQTLLAQKWPAEVDGIAPQQYRDN